MLCLHSVPPQLLILSELLSWACNRRFEQQHWTLVLMLDRSYATLSAALNQLTFNRVQVILMRIVDETQCGAKLQRLSMSVSVDVAPVGEHCHHHHHDDRNRKLHMPCTDCIQRHIVGRQVLLRISAVDRRTPIVVGRKTNNLIRALDNDNDDMCGCSFESLSFKRKSVETTLRAMFNNGALHI
jgi:hypothetical protein